MKLIVLSFFMLVMGAVTAQTPTTLFSDNFENGSSNWTLGGSAMTDSWVVDTNYMGNVIDMGIPLFPPIVVFPHTPNQPSQFTGAPKSSYLHVNDPIMCLVMNCNATYSSVGEIHATLAQPLAITDYEEVSVSYSYFVEGHVDSAYAYLEYSLDSITWNQVGNKLVGKSDWTSETASIPQLDADSAIYFRFKWSNLGYSVSNLGIGIDELTITGKEIVTHFVSNVAMDASSFCAQTAAPITVTFTSDGDFSTGNTFTAYLSDKDGDFTNAVSIGSITSTANGTLTIYGNLPASVIGTDYKVKVVSSSPSVEDIATVSIVVNAVPAVTATTSEQTINAGETATLTASGANTYTWTPSNELSSATGSEVVASPTATTTYTVTGKNSDGCTATATVTVNVSGLSVSNATAKKLVIYPNPTTDHFKIQLDDNKVLNSLAVYSIDGKEIKDFTLSNDVLTINQKGVYFVKINVSGQDYVLKAIKR